MRLVSRVVGTHLDLDDAKSVVALGSNSTFPLLVALVVALRRNSTIDSTFPWWSEHILIRYSRVRGNERRSESSTGFSSCLNDGVLDVTLLVALGGRVENETCVSCCGNTSYSNRIESGR